MYILYIYTYIIHIFIHIYIYIYVYIYVNKQAYLFGLSQPLTTPVEAPPLPAQEPEKVAFGTFRVPAQEGGGFHGRSQSLTEPKKVCRFPTSFPTNPRICFPQQQFLFSWQIGGYSALRAPNGIPYLIIARL